MNTPWGVWNDENVQKLVKVMIEMVIHPFILLIHPKDMKSKISKLLFSLIYDKQIKNLTMKKLIFIIHFVLLFNLLNAQEIKGDWSGTLDVQGTELDLVFHISQENEMLKATMDSPDQGAFGIPASSIDFDKPKLSIAIVSSGIEYIGELKGDEIEGTFKQAGQSFPFNLSRKEE